jgi:hypothetical protein
MLSEYLCVLVTAFESRSWNRISSFVSGSIKMALFLLPVHVVKTALVLAQNNSCEIVYLCDQ